MKKHFLLVLTISLLGLIGSACSNIAEEEFLFLEKDALPFEDKTSVAEAFDVYLVEAVETQNIPGLAAALVQGDEIVWAQGYGWRDIDAQLPATADTLFHIGSTNKSMTAMLVATLVDDGLIGWDQPIADIVPNFHLSESTEVVTIRHLLSMQSGIPDSAEDDFDMEDGTAEDLFQYVASVELLGKPGDEFSYSNISASLGGYVAVLAEDNQSESLYDGYADLLKIRILNPIGMQTAVVRYSDALENPNYGKSYILDRGEVVEAEPEDLDGDALAPSGVLKASANEMALYMSTQLNKGLAPNGTEIVSEKNMVEMWQPYLQGYGMGWETSQVQGVKHISHEGSFDNYLSIIGFVPELDFGYVILTNSADAAEELIDDAPDFLIDAVLYTEEAE